MEIVGTIVLGAVVGAIVIALGVTMVCLLGSVCFSLVQAMREDRSDD